MVGLLAADIMLLLATDSGTDGMGINPGYSILVELRILVENGFMPYEDCLSGIVNEDEHYQANTILSGHDIQIR